MCVHQRVAATSDPVAEFFGGGQLHSPDLRQLGPDPDLHHRHRDEQRATVVTGVDDGPTVVQNSVLDPAAVTPPRAPGLGHCTGGTAHGTTGVNPATGAVTDTPAVSRSSCDGDHRRRQQKRS